MDNNVIINNNSCQDILSFNQTVEAFNRSVEEQHPPRLQIVGKAVPPLTALAKGTTRAIGAVNKLESSVIPLLASPQGGVAASRTFRAATEADAAISGGFAIISNESPDAKFPTVGAVYDRPYFVESRKNGRS